MNQIHVCRLELCYDSVITPCTSTLRSVCMVPVFHVLYPPGNDQSFCVPASQQHAQARLLRHHGQCIYLPGPPAGHSTVWQQRFPPWGPCWVSQKLISTILIITVTSPGLSSRKYLSLLKSRRPGLNGDTGLDIPAVILQLVSHNPEESCGTNGH